MKNTTQADIYISMSPSKRLEVATGLFDFTFERLETYFKNKYPAYGRDKILSLVRERMFYGRKENISQINKSS